MAKITIPESLKVKNKVIITPRQANGILLAQVADKSKARIIEGNVNKNYIEPISKGTVSTMFGTPVIDQVVLKLNIDTPIGQELTGTDYVKFESVLVTVNQQRNIVKTPIQGRNGTVKEYISDGDYDITIDGIITSTNPNLTPLEEMENIISLLKVPNELVIVSEYIALFKVQYIVVDNYNFAQVEGSVNQIKFSLKLISDEPIELQLGITNA